MDLGIVLNFLLIGQGRVFSITNISSYSLVLISGFNEKDDMKIYEDSHYKIDIDGLQKLLCCYILCSEGGAELWQYCIFISFFCLS